MPQSLSLTMEFTYDPPLSSRARPDQPPMQTIRLQDGRRTIATARWHAANVDEGIVQLLELTVSPDQRRNGHGHRMLDAAIQQAHQYHRTRNGQLRRMWVCIEQKTQVIGRAFLTGQGFHHVGTIRNLYADQEGLIYLRAFD